MKDKSKFFKNYFILASIIWMPFFAISQQIKINGSVRDTLNKPIFNAILVASLTQNEADILDFSTTNENGTFELNIKNKLKKDSVWLNIRHIAFKAKSLKIELKKNSETNIVLDAKTENLKEVLIKSPRKVEIKGDTITYNVKGIKTEKDYTIEDVIERIPGVTINDNGQIKYKDKAISHLYINGVDLLEGRYNIATQGIPADAVKSIDVLQKHNHKRIDVGRTESDKVAFNLNIKEDRSLVFGSVKSDIGLPLLTGLLEGTPIYLKDKFQNIGSFKLNNFGKTLKNIGSSFTSSNPNIANNKLSNTNVIRPPNINGVILSDKYWLDNDSYSLTNDALHKINDSILLKWNINYNNELSKIENQSNTVFLVNSDSSIVANSSINRLRAQRLQFGINEEINKRDFYLKNNTNLQYNDQDGFKNNILNGSQIISDFKSSNLNVINSTILKKSVDKNKIITAGFLIEYDRKNEQLNVNPTVFEELFDTTSNNENTEQVININKLNINSFVNYSFNWLTLKWKLKQNINYNDFHFKSQLNQMPNQANQNFPFTSNFNYKKIGSKSQLNTKIDIGEFRASLNVLADYSNIKTSESNIDTNNESFFLFNPFALLRYKFNTRWNAGLTYNLTNSISDFSKLYRPLILSDFNVISQNPDIINRIKTSIISPYLSYSDILKSIYLKLSGKWQRTLSDVSFNNQLNDDGFIVSEVIKRPNINENKNITLTFNKGFLGFFNLNFSYAYNTSNNELIFNNEFLNVINNAHNLNLNLSLDNGTWYSIEYDAKLNLGNSKLPTNKIKNTFLFQALDFDFYLSDKTRLYLGTETVRTESSDNTQINTNTMFNTAFYYKPSKKIYFRANFTNIFNTRFFSTSNSSINFVNVSQFSLRPRQFTLGLTYSL